MRTIVLFLLFVASAAAFLAPAHAQGHDQHAQHNAMGTANGRPLETGQSAFAAIAEVTAILAGDPDTDWTKIDIDALRSHLVDMSELTLNADVDTIVQNGKIRFVVTGIDRTVSAIRRMVPAHAAVLVSEIGWNARAEILANGAELTIDSTDGGQLAMLRGLGFFGVMATGAHHQRHHLAIARGEMHH